MARWVIGLVILAVCILACHSASLIGGYQCVENETCETLCGAGQGWCLSNWCACARKRRDIEQDRCHDDKGCRLKNDCNGLFTRPRCIGNMCLCVPDVGN